MKATPTVPCMAWLLAIAGGCRAPARDEVTLLDAPIAARLDGGEHVDPVVRVVDALTGEGIAGAGLYAMSPRPRHRAGEFWHDGVEVSDRYGFVRWPRVAESRQNLFVVLAEGYGPVARWHGPSGDDEPFQVVRGIDVPVVVRDAADRPVRGALVTMTFDRDYPDLRRVVTDAGGGARVPQVDPIGGEIEPVYLAHATGLADARSGQSWEFGDAPVLLPDAARRWSEGELGCSTTVSVRVVDAAGQPVTAEVGVFGDYEASAVDRYPELAQWHSVDHDGHARFTALMSKRHGSHLWVRPARPDLRPRVVPIAAHATLGEAVVDLGEVRLRDRAQASLWTMRADGFPAHVRVFLRRPGKTFAAPTAGDGGYDGLEPEPGDRIELRPTEWYQPRPLLVVRRSATSPESDGEDTSTVRGEGSLWPQPWRVQLAGPGPWVLREPSARVRVTVVDEAGQVIPRVHLVVADRSIHHSETPVTLTHVAAGRLEFFAGADGHLSARVVLYLGDGEQRDVRLVLPRRRT